VLHSDRLIPFRQTNRYHDTLCSVTIVIVQHPTESLAPLNRSCVSEVIPVRLDEPVAQALVIAFIVIQLSNRTPILEISVKFVIPGIRGTAGQ
jgi:hypothetical protein